MFIPEEKYKVIVENSIIECIDLIVINKKGQILLGLRNNNPLKGIYYIPGGRRYKNEKILYSIKRKAKEELGIDMDENKIEFLGIYDDIYPNSMFEGLSSHYSSITYVYKIDENEENKIQGDEQHSDLKFFDIDDSQLHDMIKMRVDDMRIKKII